MSPDSQRIAIAEACGWKRVDNDPERYPYFLAPKNDWRYGNPLDVNIGIGLFPDYLNDLNAMHDAEKVLRRNEGYYQPGGLGHYLICLAEVCAEQEHDYHDQFTAAQRAEAFLRTIGKWESAK